MMRSIFLLSALFAVAFGATCNDVHYWVEEGVLLQGDLRTTQTFNQNFHATLYPSVPSSQNAGVTCTGSETLSVSATTVAPFHHTATAPGYTPIYDTFANEFDSATGKFKYIHIPTKNNNNVWNGYDSFTFTATCTPATGSPSTCSGTAAINVVYTSAASQNAEKTAYRADTVDGVKCDTTKSCANKADDGMWLARHTLPRLWDMQENEQGNAIKHTITWAGDTKDTDGLDFEWTSNYALISTYGAIGNMAARFPTFELLTFTPGQNFRGEDTVAASAASLSTGFSGACLNNQANTGAGSDVWTFNQNQQDGVLGSKYKSGASWYQKFGGKHVNCDVFAAGKACNYAPLLAPNTNTDEDLGGVWRLDVDGCNQKWQGKFTWKGMMTQTLKNGNKALLITSQDTSYEITSEIYNQAVQPNSWTDPARGFATIDHKYLLKIVLAMDTDFQFELGIDIFTVDLQQFRYFNAANEQSFGFNMIVYPKTLNAITPQSQPDRRIKGYKWIEQQWIAPTAAQCSGCNSVGRVESIDNSADSNTGANVCVSADSTDASDYTGAMIDGNCNYNNGLIYLFKGPSIGANECQTDDMVVRNTPGISASDKDSTNNCNTDFQNITLRGTAKGSAPISRDGAGFGFEGKITLTFLLFNGEHPHFVINPKMYVKSISIDGAFQGSSSTCRGSPYWPVPDPVGASLPRYLCEEVDARTFGPTDWASIFFDIKDVDADLVEMTKLNIVVNSVNIRFFPETATEGDTTSVWWQGTTTTPSYQYLNFRSLKAASVQNTDVTPAVQMLVNPTAPSSVIPPQNTDYGFSFTPGAHNENAKITIYCTLRIKSSTTKNRRFGAKQAAPDAENQVTEKISINRKTNAQLSSLSSNNRVVEGSSNNNSNAASSSSNVTVMVLAAACAVLLAAVIGMVLYVVRQKNAAEPKRVNSSA